MSNYPNSLGPGLSSFQLPVVSAEVGEADGNEPASRLVLQGEQHPRTTITQHHCTIRQHPIWPISYPP